MIGTSIMVDRPFKQDADRPQIEPGKRINFPERVKKKSDELTDKGSELRAKINDRLSDGFVNPANDNIDTATVVGAIGAFIVWTIEDYLPGRVGAESSVVDMNVDEEGGEAVYIIDSNAAIESQARFRAILDAGTGVTSLWTDDIEVEDFDIIRERPARDTYRYRITVSF